MTAITVDLADLHELSNLVSDIDTRYDAPPLQTIGRMHELIMKMAGEHVNELYAQEDIAIEIPK